MRRHSTWSSFALHAGLTVACVVTLYPVLWVVKMALSPAEGMSLSANPFPTHITGEHFSAVLFAKSATGNLATEDLLWMLDGLGISTGVDLGAMVRTSHWLAGHLGRPSPSAVVRALAAARPGVSGIG